ncbi:MAG: peptidoglycan binding domain-containing protein [Eubacteriales bacterium]|jgi:vancomycin resistance protein YoaR
MKKLSKNLINMIGLLVLLILVFAAIYVYGVYHFSTHFYTGSSFDGLNIGEMTADDAKYAIQNQIRHYTLTCHERNGQTDTITGDQIYMTYDDDGTIEQLLKDQNPKLWIFYLGRGISYTGTVGFTYDKNAIDTVMTGMKCFSSENDVEPTNAEIVDDGTDFSISQADEGSSLDRDKTKQAIITAIESGETSVDFDKLGLYKTTTVSADDPALAKQISTINDILSTSITYDFVDRKFTLNKNNLHDYIVQDADGNYQLSKPRIAEFVANMAYETDTYGLPHKFRTTSGVEITLNKGGDYGWCINQNATTLDLYNAILKGESGEREPVYLYRALDRSSNDIGDTYVEVCIEKQELWCYQNGTLVLDTSVITGNHAAGQDTPNGCVWAIDAHESPAVFSEHNNLTVQYWMPFYDSCGMHDAKWRTEAMFDDKTTWLKNGSNGCINMRLEDVAKVFDVMNVGYPVIIYYSESQVAGTQPTGTVTPG